MQGVNGNQTKDATRDEVSIGECFLLIGKNILQTFGTYKLKCGFNSFCPLYLKLVFQNNFQIIIQMHKLMVKSIISFCEIYYESLLLEFVLMKPYQVCLHLFFENKYIISRWGICFQKMFWIWE